MPDKSATLYRVLHTQVGPFPKDHVFSHDEFVRLHPLKDTPENRDTGLFDGGKDAYHGSLIQRLLDAGAIAVDESGKDPDPTPLGPESMRPAAPKVAPATTPVAAPVKK